MFEIICEPDFEYGSSGDLVNCTFYCRTEFGDFPDNQWTDFPIALLSGWTDKLTGIAGSQFATFVLFFEDGPFWIEGIKTAAQTELTFKTTHADFRAYPNVQCSFDELVLAVLRMGIHLKHHMTIEKRWQDVNKINECCSKLKTMLKIIG